jgi:uncharacterized protein YkwD
VPERGSTTRRAALVGVLAVALTLGIAAPSAQAGPLRERLLSIMNRVRENHDLRALKLNVRLSDDAKAHTRKMIRRDELFDPSNLAGVLRPYRWNDLGADVVGCAGTLRHIVHLWMHHAEHRAILLHPKLRRAGLGVIVAAGKTSCGRNAIWATSLMYG